MKKTNWKYWDKHKSANIISAIALIIFLLASYTSGDMDEKAWEYAGNSITPSETNAIIRWYNLYEQKLPQSYYTLDTLTTVLWYVILITVFYSAWSALDIPTRYEEKE